MFYLLAAGKRQQAAATSAINSDCGRLSTTTSVTNAAMQMSTLATIQTFSLCAIMVLFVQLMTAARSGAGGMESLLTVEQYAQSCVAIASLAVASAATRRLHCVHLCHAASLLLYVTRTLFLYRYFNVLRSFVNLPTGLHCQFVACGELQHAAQHADGVQHWLAIELSRNQLYCFADVVM
jgi:hypothetical protein